MYVNQLTNFFAGVLRVRNMVCVCAEVLWSKMIQLLLIKRYIRIVVNNKCKLIQVLGTLYRYISFTAV